MTDYKWVFGMCLVLLEIYMIATLPAYFGDAIYLIMAIMILLTVVITAKI